VANWRLWVSNLPYLQAEEKVEGRSEIGRDLAVPVYSDRPSRSRGADSRGPPGDRRGRACAAGSPVGKRSFPVRALQLSLDPGGDGLATGST